MKEFVFLGLLCLILLVNGWSFEEDTGITGKEAEVLFKFKERMRPKLPHKYMEEDIYLIKWLRARKFDVNAAEEMLINHLKWRSAQKMDTIDKEDWKDMESDYVWNLDGVDKEGRPLVQAILRDWDVRRATVAGKRGRLIRWVYKFFEDATKLVRKFQNEGKNVTRFSIVLDAEGFNPVTHGCTLCIPIYFALVNAYEEQYPGALDTCYVINTPEFFRNIVRLLWPLLSQDTRKAIKMLGTDKNEWRKFVSDAIDDSQLLPTFGGKLKSE